jgi:hypothetical protein
LLVCFVFLYTKFIKGGFVMSSISGYSQYNVTPYSYNNQQVDSSQSQAQTQQIDFSQLLNINGGSNGQTSANGVDAQSGASGWAQSSSYQAGLDKMMFNAKTEGLGGGGSGGFAQDMNALATAINSGDLQGAKDALSTIESHKPQSGSSTTASTTTDGTAQAAATSTDKRAQDFQALQSALDSGDMSAAKTALNTIQSDMQSHKGGHHHGGGHHHSSTQTADASNATDTTQSTASQGGQATQGSSAQSLLSVMMQKMLSQYTSTNSLGSLAATQSVSA